MTLAIPLGKNCAGGGGFAVHASITHIRRAALGFRNIPKFSQLPTRTHKSQRWGYNSPHIVSNLLQLSARPSGKGIGLRQVGKPSRWICENASGIRLDWILGDA